MEEFIEMEKGYIILNKINQINEIVDFVYNELYTFIKKDKTKNSQLLKKPVVPEKDAGKPFNDSQILIFFIDRTIINREYTLDKILVIQFNENI